MKNFEDIGFAAIGLCSTSLGGIMGWLNFEDVGKAAILSAVGAAVGYAVKKVLDFLVKKVNGPSDKP